MSAILTAVNVLGRTQAGRPSAALRWIDLEPALVIVDEAVCMGEIGSPKTPESRQRVKMDPANERALEQWRQLAELTQPDDFVFALRKNTSTLEGLLHAGGPQFESERAHHCFH